MKIIGITGGVASGKNFIANIFEEFGAEVFDADKIVHNLLKNDKILIAEITHQFPQTFVNREISRKILGEIVYQSSDNLIKIEKIIHPKVREQYQIFIANHLKNNVDLVVLNIPLLLEKGGYEYDYLVAIKCDKELRWRRFLERALLNQNKNLEISDGVLNLENELMNKFSERFEKIYKLQIDDETRFKKANFIIDNNLDFERVKEQVEKLIKIISKKPLN